MTTGLDIIGLESVVSLIGHINLWMKLTGKHSAGNPDAVIGEVGTGKVAMVKNMNPRGNRKSSFGNLGVKCARLFSTLRVRDVKQPFMVEYCDTPYIKRKEKQGMQNIPKEGDLDVCSSESSI